MILDEVATKTVATALQRALTDLIDLGLLAKQAHWNVTGPHFRTVHLHLDELAGATREHGDSVAERLAALGVSPDGRASTIATESTLPGLPAGPLADTAAVEAVTGLLAATISGLRAGIDATGGPDPVSQDLLIGITADLEKQHWMFAAQTRQTSSA
ncbi:DNA starvation/stationary phase protection protein [Amycolatopsis deserti]|uniref:DNA starvation/stationary phase protection protein n=1 Tax=Amycolatopsis deserti TaxID=185696 RepID=A0ABQ3IGC8_9PSEU|nr:DNA starvation/stationary phase protection protein [Amycolatopsis deserti]GHE81251.1 DNA starvation/stationary phase protection protein [Amycolatopsis deserti]